MSFSENSQQTKRKLKKTPENAKKITHALVFSTGTLHVLELEMFETTCSKEPKCVVSVWLQQIFLLVKKEPNSASLLALVMSVFPYGLTELQE